MNDTTNLQATSPGRWQPLAARERRVLGVLIEKAKTTPDVYPMSTNALRSGCNQKNNRFPLMEIELEDVEESLSKLRAVGAVTEVQGGGRVARYRHQGYDWFGADKVELAVMAELLLRGAQSEGELRGRAARMEPISDVSALRPILTSLKSKGLVVSLTPEGRGHIVTHALYEPRELEKVRAEAQAGAASHEADQTRPEREFATAGATAPQRVSTGSSSQYASQTSLDQLRQTVDELREELAKIRQDLADLGSNFR